MTASTAPATVTEPAAQQMTQMMLMQQQAMHTMLKNAGVEIPAVPGGNSTDPAALMAQMQMMMEAMAKVSQSGASMPPVSTTLPALDANASADKPEDAEPELASKVQNLSVKNDSEEPKSESEEIKIDVVEPEEEEVAVVAEEDSNLK